MVWYKATKGRHFIYHWLRVDQADFHDVQLVPFCGTRKQVQDIAPVRMSRLRRHHRSCDYNNVNGISRCHHRRRYRWHRSGCRSRCRCYYRRWRCCCRRCHWYCCRCYYCRRCRCCCRQCCNICCPCRRCCRRCRRGSYTVVIAVIVADAAIVLPGDVAIVDAAVVSAGAAVVVAGAVVIVILLSREVTCGLGNVVGRDITMTGIFRCLWALTRQPCSMNR